MGVVGDDTAPKRAALHSARRVETVLGGRATPCSWNVAKPAGRVWNEKVRGKEVLRASRMRLPAYGASLAFLKERPMFGGEVYGHNFVTYSIAGNEANVEGPFGGHRKI